MLKEFKKFITQSSSLDMAIGIVIGAGFGKIITSFVTDIIMPPVGWFLGGVDFTRLYITLKPATSIDPAITMNYGLFINTVIDFTLVAFAIFMVIKQINKFRKKNPTSDNKETEPSEEILLLRQIRNSLKK